MNELIEFLTSKEVIVVYIVASIACLLCFIIYIVDKNYQKRRQRQNTKELNKLVEEVSEYVEVEENSNDNLNKEPIIEAVETVVEETKVENIKPEVIETPTIKVEEKVEEIEELELIQEEVKLSDIEPVENIVLNSMPEPIKVEEELEYTTIEPDEATAKLQLQKLAEELEKAEAETNNIDLTAYEEEQESNAIISLEELVKKSKEMYEANEITQYADEGNEPISLADLEKRMKEATIIAAEPVENYNKPFIIEEVVDEIKPEEITELLEIDPIEIKTEKVHLDDLNTVKTVPAVETKPAYQTTRKFQSSPVISPIYGIERKTPTVSDIELENTANYEKLDEEIKKTNEFIMTLKELQKNLD